MVTAVAGVALAEAAAAAGAAALSASGGTPSVFQAGRDFKAPLLQGMPGLKAKANIDDEIDDVRAWS